MVSDNAPRACESVGESLNDERIKIEYLASSILLCCRDY